MTLQLILLALCLRNEGILCQVITNVSGIMTAGDDTIDDATIELEADTEIDLYDDSDRQWIKKAVVDVGYYLRFHKFNEYDRRFHTTDPGDNQSHMYRSFPLPPLKYFHWDVFNQCKFDFITCLRYIYENTVDAYLQHSVDTISLIRLQNITQADTERIQTIETECQHLKQLDLTEAEPFLTTLDKFQWKVSASYYMCWYTMQRRAELAHFDEPCDNFANCLQNGTTSNHDVRADDKIPFQCAWYSFCPDPCCSDQKLKLSADQCWNAAVEGNPCRHLNNKTCSFNFTPNRSFTSLVYNQWNVSCICGSKGFQWHSRYGICFDYNECHFNPCDLEIEECSNLLGDYVCSCKFGYKWSSQKNSCVENEILIRALKRFDGLDPDANGIAAPAMHPVLKFTKSVWIRRSL